MKTKNNITLEYFANFIHYGIFLLFSCRQQRINNFFYKLYKKLFKLFNKEFSDEMIKANNHYLYNYEYGFLISVTHHNFGYFWSAYAGCFSFILLGIVTKLGYAPDGIITFIIGCIPIGIAYIPQYKYVFKNDRYIKFFKKFDKKGPKWQRKCKWMALIFLIFGFPATFLGMLIMDFIIKKL